MKRRIIQIDADKCNGCGLCIPNCPEGALQMIKLNNLKSITVVNMEVPCCFGLQHIVDEAIKKSGKILP